MSKVTVTGMLIEKTPVQEISEKFRKMEAVVCVTNGRYDDYFKFEVINDAIDQVESIETMSEVVVGGYLSGRKYINPAGETKYITNVRLRTIRKAGAGYTESVPIIEDAPW
jgi:two-component SAPR family response regulator